MGGKPVAKGHGFNRAVTGPPLILGALAPEVSGAKATKRGFSEPRFSARINPCPFTFFRPNVRVVGQPTSHPPADGGHPLPRERVRDLVGTGTVPRHPDDTLSEKGCVLLAPGDIKMVMSAYLDLQKETDYAR
jgi:hypothetical protein